MGDINDKYKSKIEHSVLLNGHPIDNHDVVDGRVIIKPESYARPNISTIEKDQILKELADDLKHYGLDVIDVNDKLIRVKADGFEMDLPKSLVIPYDDDIYASILKQHQRHFSNQVQHK